MGREVGRKAKTKDVVSSGSKPCKQARGREDWEGVLWGPPRTEQGAQLCTGDRRTEQGVGRTTKRRLCLSNPADFVHEHYWKESWGWKFCGKETGSCLVRGRSLQTALCLPPAHQTMSLVQGRGLPSARNNSNNN